jgi:hypothetical protein
MNQRQKSTIIRSVVVIAGTAAFVAVMLNVRDYVNRAEALRTMEHLGERVRQYRDKFNSTPPKSYLTGQRTSLQDVRLGDFEYRAPWVEFGASADTILAYTRKNYQFLVGKGYIVMRLDGHVEWMEKAEFEALLRKQQTQAEIELLQKPSQF